MNIGDKVTLKKEIYQDFSKSKNSWRKDFFDVVNDNKFLTILFIGSDGICSFEETIYVLEINKLELFNAVKKSEFHNNLIVAIL